MNQDPGIHVAPRMQAALDELAGLIAERFPGASFMVREQFDPPGISLVATVDVDDTDDVFAVVVDRLVDLQVKESLPVYVTPLLPIGRIIAEFHEQRTRALPPLLSTG